MRRDRFLNFVDLVNRLDAETKVDRRGRRIDSISRLDFHVLDGLDDLPFALSGRLPLSHSISMLHERTLDDELRVRQVIERARPGSR